MASEHVDHFQQGAQEAFDEMQSTGRVPEAVKVLSVREVALNVFEIDIGAPRKITVRLVPPWPFRECVIGQVMSDLSKMREEGR